MSALGDLRRNIQRRSKLADKAAKLVKYGLAGPPAKPVAKSVAKPAARPAAPPRSAALAPAAPPKPVPAAPKVFHSARAARPIGIFYDELARGSNPFAFIQTAGVADASEGPERIAELFDRYGLVKVRGVYSAERSKALNAVCIDHSQLTPDAYKSVITKETKMGAFGGAALRDDRLWSYSADPKIVEIIQQILGRDSFEFGTSIAAHYTARGMHRDYRMLCENDESLYSVKNPQKRIVRILHYCGIAGGALGYIPFSHNEQIFAETAEKLGIPHDTAWFDRHREVLTHARLQKKFDEADEIERHVCWAYADPGDIIVSNSAMLHCGEYLTGPRYFYVSTYANSDPETLKLARAPLKEGPSIQYYEYQDQHGLSGARTVLDGLTIAA